MTTSVDLNESQAPTLAIIITLGTLLAAIAVALRFYTRITIIGRVFRNDYCILAALVAAVGFALCNGIGLQYGFGRRSAAITREELTVLFQIGIPLVFFYHLSHILIKSSILLQYTRICILPFEKRICYAIMIFVVVDGIVWIVFLLLSCMPLQAVWEKDLPGAKCINTTVAYYARAATLILADFAILVILPFFLRHSSLPWGQKLMPGVVLALGGVATIASILRVPVIYMAANSDDPAWDKAPNAILCAIEVDLGLICSCAVTLMPLFRRWLPDFLPKGLGRNDIDPPETVSVESVLRSRERNHIQV